MVALITGGRGFLGSLLAKAIAGGALAESADASAEERGEAGGGAEGSAARDSNDGAGAEADVRVITVDVTPPSERDINAPGVKHVVGDITDATFLAALIRPSVTHIFHLAAVVSGAAEKDYDLGMMVNFDATRCLLQACRAAAHCPRLIMASSVAVFGAPSNSPSNSQAAYTEDTPALPRSSYGTQKAMAELLLSDASRRGFVDSIVLRLPTVVVRPGSPNAATSSFCSSIIREPLHGKPATCPVDPALPLWLQSPRTVIRNILHAARLPALPPNHPRTITLPGLTTTAAELVGQLPRFGADPSLVQWVPDPFINDIVASWPGHIHTPTAIQLGFQPDTEVASIVEEYVQEYVKPMH
ncbi:hypothetical protein CLOM_g17135 [Closterium sp. NIES-68]|nr:hypothetical protein CLOM_g17135 [Closterium sp. NIES-68]GJP76591.1 hypothetical protein CLOP_g7011 [Closterium sp. NIES-67]